MSKSLAVQIIQNAQNNASNKINLIEKALASSRLSILTLTEFMNITGLHINKYMVDKFYHSIKNDIPIYLDDNLIRWCGYAGESFEQKKNLLKLIKKYKVPIIELDNTKYAELRNEIQKPYGQLAIRNIVPDKKVLVEENDDDEGLDDEYSEEESDQETEDRVDTEFNKIYPKVDRSNGKNRTKHILIMPKDFKKIVIRLPTERGEQACDYHIELEQLIQDYMNYQVQFISRREELLQIELAESRAEREADRKKAEADRKKADRYHNELMGQIDELNDNIEDLSDKLEIDQN
jgi:hypothetical protein